jgi:predicted enzyme related to lactoylglutathione lyase
VRVSLKKVLLAATLFASACASQPARVSTPGPTPGIKTGKFIWHDLATDDLPAARRFYGDLLGWQFEDMQRLGRPYVMASLGGRRVGGLVAVDPEPGQEVSQWVGYVSVPNVDQTVAAVEKAGGRTLISPRDIQNVARAAVSIDPQGAVIGFARRARGDPEDEPAPVERTFFWMEYLAREPDAAVSFFSNLLGYKSEMTDKVGTAEYYVLRRDRARGGVLRVPDESIRPRWLPYILVSDPGALAQRAESLGGRVVVAPRPDLRKGTLAVVADPSGGVVALQKWPI